MTNGEMKDPIKRGSGPLKNRLSFFIGSNGGNDIVIDMAPSAQGPNVLFTGGLYETRRACLKAVIRSVCSDFSPDEIQLFLIDRYGDGLINGIGSAPHCFFNATKETESKAVLYVLREELLSRQMYLHQHCSSSVYSYFYSNNRTEQENTLPLLFVVIDGLDRLIKDHSFGREFHSLIRTSRALGIHFIAAADKDSEGPFSYCFNHKEPIDPAAAIERSDELNVSSDHRSYGRQAHIGKTWEWDIVSDSGKKKSIRLTAGDLCELEKACDVVVCSAYKRDYFPTSQSLIGSLMRHKDIDLFRLSKDPEIDLRERGCWLSRDTLTSYKRVACIELLGNYEAMGGAADADIILKRGFSTLRYILEQADLAGIPLKTVAMTLFGSGEQGIEPAYVIGTMISQCMNILRYNEGVDCISIYEKDIEKATFISEATDKVIEGNRSAEKVFVSYSSKQAALAEKTIDLLRRNNISCWMAPASIPPGESYLKMIPVAISRAQAVLLLLTEDSMSSRWVQKEIGTAIGSNKIIIPFQSHFFLLNDQFRFLLDGEQIILGGNKPMEEDLKGILSRIQEVLR